jgi:ADP-ribosylglycohydrolase
MNTVLEERIRRSAEWAAFGDALGFMTELADSDQVQQRLGAERVVDTIGWRRRVGGYNGVSVDFPPGTYSDDTQLRLATSRAIRADGTFDVAAFSKVELPAWANYALGAGTGSKEAAANLARTSATWYSNFFDGRRTSYVRAGGNGAAMRIQPHVWASRDLDDQRTLLVDVVRNAICTHGHARGILGACLHALTLAFALRERRPAGIKELRDLTAVLESVPNVVYSDGDMRLFWLGPWEDASGSSFATCTTETIREIIDDIEKLSTLKDHGRLAEIYDRAVWEIGATEPAVRGSGTKTALLAAFAASLANPAEPLGGLLPIANALGSDTDSIATMAGAIVGVCADVGCDGAIQDRDYIGAEARRLAAVACKDNAESFRYPDLRTWKPPRAAVDAVGLVGDCLWLNGLGALTPLDEPRVKTGDDMLIWCRLSFGQTILARVRSKPHTLIVGRTKGSDAGAMRQRDAKPPTRLRDLFGDQGVSAPRDDGRKGRPETDSLNETLQRIIAEGFSPDLIGRIILQQADGRSDFVERGIALTATILTAYEARVKRSRKA